MNASRAIPPPSTPIPPHRGGPFPPYLKTENETLLGAVHLDGRDELVVVVGSGIGVQHVPLSDVVSGKLWRASFKMVL